MHNSREAPLRGQLMCMKTMPLIRTYKYNSGNLLSKGCSCMCETMPLSRLLMCVQNNASRLDLHV